MNPDQMGTMNPMGQVGQTGLAGQAGQMIQNGQHGQQMLQQATSNPFSASALPGMNGAMADGGAPQSGHTQSDVIPTVRNDVLGGTQSSAGQRGLPALPLS